MTYVAPERLQQLFMSNKLQVNFFPLSFRGCLMLSVKKEELWIFSCLILRKSSSDDDAIMMKEQINNSVCSATRGLSRRRWRGKAGRFTTQCITNDQGQSNACITTAHDQIVLKIRRKLPAPFPSIKTVQNKFWISILVWNIGTCNKKSRFQTVDGLFAPKIQAGLNPLELQAPDPWTLSPRAVEIQMMALN